MRGGEKVEGKGRTRGRRKGRTREREKTLTGGFCTEGGGRNDKLYVHIRHIRMHTPPLPPTHTHFRFARRKQLRQLQ